MGERTMQALAFDKVLPWEGQREAVIQKEDGNFYIQIKAEHAGKVAFRILEEEYPCKKLENGCWELCLPMHEGIHYVQLLIDDVEVLTPLLPIGYGYSRPYNFVELPAADSDFYSIKEVPHGSVRQEIFYSTVTDAWERCMVYTPPQYETEDKEEFPVLYLQHGHGENEIGWSTAGRVNFILDNLIAQEKAVPFIVVMNNGMVLSKDENGRDIVDYQLLEHRLLKDVIPFVEKKFRVKKEKEYRGMAGLSMGSAQTSIIALKHPELFSYMGIFSGFMHDIIGGSPLDMVEREPSKNEHLALLDDVERFEANFKVLFRAMGAEDQFFENFEGDDKMLEEKGIPHIRKVYPGIHDWNVWRKCIRDFAQLIFKEEK